MIRRAEPKDYKTVVPLIIQAMGELANKFSNTSNSVQTIALFEYFFKQKDNQYSFENTLVYEENGKVLGSLNAYDGAKLLKLRQNFFDYLFIHNGVENLTPEAETESGEFYLDTISVHHKAQGKGIGKQLIDAGIDWAIQLGHKKVGLLVETNNNRALKLYQDKNFEIQHTKKFFGGLYYHMVYNL
ncbi:GNAT family N-acetyltransferase [Pedobacter yonginense]|uniref:GNAT family N-acetyltransferase n=1 Tax=Pedobacter yonginense TaxID=651869 RepID=A0A317ES23_9SPHI|nr:GNAT family N-acetyltransferase [Pedobacter yonginense]PWS28669.1 GNAT family N-acetyltransferase [Pedobacter yonginense]